MSNFPWLTVAGAIPLAGAVVIALTPGRSAPGSDAALLGVLAFVLLLSLAMVTLLRRRRTALVPA